MKTYLEDRKLHTVDLELELPGPWSKEINELVDFFKDLQVPERLQLDSVTTIFDISLFLKTHFSICKRQNGNERYIPYLDRLRSVKDILSDVSEAKEHYGKAYKLLCEHSGITA